MVNMMSTTGLEYGFLVLWGLHILSVIAFFTGVLFLIVIAVKTFSPAQLKTWAIWLMIVGTVVCLFTIAVTGQPWIGRHAWGSGMGAMKMEQMGQMMEMMMRHGEDDPSDQHEAIERMMRNMLDGAPNRPRMMQ